MTDETDENGSTEFDTAILSLVSRSPDALRTALFWVERSRRRGDIPLADAQQRLIVQMLADGSFYLDLSEDLARDLVRRAATKTNLELLANVLAATNQAAEAAQVTQLADQTAPTEEESATRVAVAQRHGGG